VLGEVGKASLRVVFGEEEKGSDVVGEDKRRFGSGGE
jgi:hypothetical protein